jgi:hypothetical protein
VVIEVILEVLHPLAQSLELAHPWNEREVGIGSNTAGQERRVAEIARVRRAQRLERVRVTPGHHRLPGWVVDDLGQDAVAVWSRARRFDPQPLDKRVLACVKGTGQQRGVRRFQVLRHPVALHAHPAVDMLPRRGSRDLRLDRRSLKHQRQQ